MTNSIKTFVLLFIAALFLTACEKDEPEVPNEEELITTVRYTLTPAGSTDAIEFSFTDLDDNGPMEPVYTSGILTSGVTYTGKLEFLDERNFPAEDITEEIMEEDEEHQVFFASSLSDLTVAYTDQDADGNPLGLATTLTAASAGNGTLTIILRHEPMKSATGVANGDITNAGGESDIEVTFNVSVQ